MKHASALLLLSLTPFAAALPNLLDIPIIQEIRRSEIFVRQGNTGPAAASAPWVTVDDESQPATTYTPSPSVISGSTSWEHAAPHDLTADVYTWTTWGEVSTSTGDPPNPTATGKNAQGTFSRCYNKDGDYAPFCRPFHNSTLFVGSTYYITWDPDFYNHTKTNVSTDIAVRVDFWNGTSHKFEKLETFDTVPSSFGFWPFKVEGKYLKGHKHQNISFTLLESPHGSNQKTASKAVLPAYITHLGLETPGGEKLPTGKSLYIALPVALGTVFFLLIGVFLWNRKTRRIQLGAVMSRKNRNGYSGRRERRLLRSSNNNKNNGIQLDANPVLDPSGGRRHTDPFSHADDYTDAPDLGRDSAELESLAGSDGGRFESQGARGGNNNNNNNTFRDEMDRQNRERRGEPDFL